jgi:hypothetical protein
MATATYSAYLQLLLPEDASLGSIAIDGKLQASNSQPKQTKPRQPVQVHLAVATASEQGKTSIGFPITIPPRTKIQLVLSYTYPHSDLYASGEPTYHIKFFKQPGTRDEQYSFSFFYPSNVALTYSLPTTRDIKSPVRFDEMLSGDSDITITFKKK